MAHRVFVAFLFLTIFTAAVAVGVRGFSYYATPLAQRPFLSDYNAMKPSAPYSHGLGIVGASMITIGVAMYSTRKRVKRLWSLGKLSRWLEVHIFLCLLGPILVVYHTTFKAGGIAAISLWCMLSVAASGIIGRFLYVQIPRNIQGHELSEREISEEMDRLNVQLSKSQIGAQLTQAIDNSFGSMKKPATIAQAMALYFQLHSMKRQVKRAVHKLLQHNHVDRATGNEIAALARSRASLMQKTFVLGQVERLFYYWHAVHLPFTIIMFITLAAHVGVTIFLGYRWIF